MTSDYSKDKKKATTSVIWMDTEPDMKLKDVAKAFSKKFVVSSSVENLPNGKKEIILQGDHMDKVAIMVVEQFKVNPEDVCIPGSRWRFCSVCSALSNPTYEGSILNRKAIILFYFIDINYIYLVKSFLLFHNSSSATGRTTSTTRTHRR
jgi:translation initiation factor 1 (eIF-1/SUI1)